MKKINRINLIASIKSKEREIKDIINYLEIIKKITIPRYFFIKHINKEIHRRKKRILEQRIKLNKQGKGTIYESIK